MTRLFNEIAYGDETFEVIIGLNDISIKTTEIIGLLGYKNQEPPCYVTGLIDSAVTCLHNRIQIRAGYRILDECLPEKGEGRASGIFTFPEIISASIKNSEKAILFIVTIGSEMEDLSREMIRNGDPVQGYIYDLLASAAVESSAEALHKHIRKKVMMNNMKVSNRYSPGYCGWNVDQQKILFSYLPDNFCGINLTSSSLMLPVKSISGIIGAGADVSYKDYGCRQCGLQNCTFRPIQYPEKKQH